jgi:hypothetical protein
MGKAIGFAVLIVVLAVFLPDVLHALQEFLLTFFARATALLNAVQPQAVRVPSMR